MKHTFRFTILLAGIVVCTIVLSVLRQNNSSTLVAETSIISVDGRTKDDGKKVDIWLRNDSSHEVVITRIVTSCHCVSLGKQGSIAIAPKSRYGLTAQVKIPRAGTVEQHIHVFHSASTNPIHIVVKLTGRQSLPFISRKVNQWLTFPALSIASPRQQIVIETLEELGSKHWLAYLECEEPLVQISSAEITEEPEKEAGTVKRQYIYTLGWKEIPTDVLEVRGKIYAIESGSQRRFVIGLVTASLARD